MALALLVDPEAAPEDGVFTAELDAFIKSAIVIHFRGDERTFKMSDILFVSHLVCTGDLFFTLQDVYCPAGKISHILIAIDSSDLVIAHALRGLLAMEPTTSLDTVGE